MDTYAISAYEELIDDTLFRVLQFTQIATAIECAEIYTLHRYGTSWSARWTHVHSVANVSRQDPKRLISLFLLG